MGVRGKRVAGVTIGWGGLRQAGCGPGVGFLFPRGVGAQLLGFTASSSLAWGIGGGDQHRPPVRPALEGTGSGQT